jgi:YidC/Oxa1 family membrane protein insertase
LFAVFDVPVSGAYHAVEALAGLTTTTAAIVCFTVFARLLMHPLTRAAVRGEKARAALAPQLKESQEKYRKDPQKLLDEQLELHREAGVSMFAGILPMLVQAPFLMVMYRLFSAQTISGEPNWLLGQTLFGTPLGSHWLGSFGHTPVFLALFALMTLVAWLTTRWQAHRAERSGALDGPFVKLLRLLPYGTVLAAAVLPLATGIYLLTSATWTLAERALLYREPSRPVKPPHHA